MNRVVEDVLTLIASHGAETVMDQLLFNDAIASPQIGIDLGGRDINGVRNIQGGENLAVLGADRWNLDLGAGTNVAAQRGNVAINYDVGRGLLIYDGALGKLLAINETVDNISGTRQIVASAVDPTVVFTILRAAAAQAADILQAQMSDGTIRARIDRFGRGEFSNSFNVSGDRDASLGVAPLGAGNRGLSVKANVAQAADLLEVVSSTNALLLAIAADGGIRMAEQTDPAAPPANQAHLYTRDNGAGKTQLVVRFPTGVVQVLATEP